MGKPLWKPLPSPLKKAFHSGLSGTVSVKQGPVEGLWIEEGGGGLMAHVEFKKRQFRISLMLRNPPLSPIDLRNGNVACHYRFSSPVGSLCRMSYLRNGNVAVSNLVVQTHSDWGGAHGWLWELAAEVLLFLRYLKLIF